MMSPRNGKVVSRRNRGPSGDIAAVIVVSRWCYRRFSTRMYEVALLGNHPGYQEIQLLLMSFPVVVHVKAVPICEGSLS